MKSLLTWLLLAYCVAAQAQPSTPPLPNACPTPQQLLPVHLYGRWQARFEGKDQTATSATLWFERHAELAGSVSGRLVREGGQAQLAGDVDDGEFTLEESLDGRSISATWTGRVVAGSCGKEIRGRWAPASGTSDRHFVLRKQGGWE